MPPSEQEKSDTDAVSRTFADGRALSKRHGRCVATLCFNAVKAMGHRSRTFYSERFRQKTKLPRRSTSSAAIRSNWVSIARRFTRCWSPYEAPAAAESFRRAQSSSSPKRRQSWIFRDRKTAVGNIFGMHADLMLAIACPQSAGLVTMPFVQ